MTVDLPTVRSLTELAELVERDSAVYLRYSPGPESDAAHSSTDHESGLTMPGLAVNPLAAPGWWTLPVEDWLARRVCQYLRETAEGARPWLLSGRVVDIGPDNEPLLVDARPVAWVGAELVEEARTRYARRLTPGAATHRDR
ncbi:DUF6098 family protein [Saccharomonospora saliphila]|uniref:DUF6098 family protein n=1 Tax=Saccharomonospora saliphila TaxID=369829 RepID=UPI00037EE6A2|nr:DUF6098 family protein [Saccharomonospora saliphila]